MPLLIDELQFLLNAAFVTVDFAGRRFANVLHEEDHQVQECISAMPSTEAPQLHPSVRIVMRRFKPIRDLAPDVHIPLRLPIQHVTAELSFLVTTRPALKSTFTIYCNSETSPTHFWALPEFSDFLAQASAFLADAPVPPLGESHHQLTRLYSQFEESEYLESVLNALRDRVVEHLSRTNEHFAEFATHPFFLQFFLATDGSDFSDAARWLRFFPLRDQLRMLSDPSVTEAIRETLTQSSLPVPSDIARFITHDYLWNSSRAFVGYAYETATSLYLSHWEDEPRAQGVHLSKEEQTERAVATAIMQALRSDTPHLLILPLFANRQSIGVAVINCPESVPLRTRIGPVRSARDLGFLISLALKTDDLVNHIQEEKRRATQVRSYKHATQSILHGEGSYCMELESFLQYLSEASPPGRDPRLDAYTSRLSYIVRDKKSMIEEFKATADPIRHVPPQYLYPTLQGIPPEQTRIPLAQISDLVELLETICCPDGHLQITPRFGSALLTAGGVLDLDYYVLARIFGNLIRNSSRIATERAIIHPACELSLDLQRTNGIFGLRITALDNCGGFDADILAKTRGAVTFDSWSAYLSEKERPRGMGFFMLARYAAASNGYCYIANMPSPSPAGARVDLLIGFNPFRTAENIDVADPHSTRG